MGVDLDSDNGSRATTMEVKAAAVGVVEGSVGRYGGDINNLGQYLEVGEATTVGEAVWWRHCGGVSLAGRLVE